MNSADIKDHAAEMIIAAQGVLDDWVQDENGFDEELGEGGACDLIADAMAAVLRGAGVEEITTVHTEIDGGHTFLVALLDDGVFSIDIPPSVYETGGGYVWTKRDGVVLDAEHLTVDRIEPPMSVAEFDYRYCEGPEPRREAVLDVRVADILRQTDPFTTDVWMSGVIRREAVETRIREDDLETVSWQAVILGDEETRLYHEGRVAFLVVNPDDTPLQVRSALNEHGYEELDIEDGHHRLAAASYAHAEWIRVAVPEAEVHTLMQVCPSARPLTQDDPRP